MLQRGFESDWLGNTFSMAVFLGNGLIAIVSGLLAHGLVETASMGPTAPFDAAIAVLLFGGVIIVSTWSENYGDSSDKDSLVDTFRKAGSAIFAGTLPPLPPPRKTTGMPPIAAAATPSVRERPERGGRRRPRHLACQRQREGRAGRLWHLRPEAPRALGSKAPTCTLHPMYFGFQVQGSRASSLNLCLSP